MFRKCLLIIALIIAMAPSTVYADVLSPGQMDSSAVMRDISRQSNAVAENAIRTLDRYNQPILNCLSPYYSYGIENPEVRAIIQAETAAQGTNSTIGSIRQDTNNLLNR